MSRRNQKIDPAQMALDFSAKVDAFIEAKTEIVEAICSAGPRHQVENEFEACIEIIAAVKRSMREAGMSREQLVDAINDYYGRTDKAAGAEPPTCRKPLTIHMLNNYLSKPAEYPLPAYLLLPIQHATKSLEPAKTIVAPEGAQVATGEEVRQMQLGKISEHIAEMRRLERELKGKRR